MPASTDGDQARAAVDDPHSLVPGSPARVVLDFLVEHPEESFTPEELRDRARVDGGHVDPALEWLADMGVAETVGEVRWTVGPDDRRAALTAMMLGLETIRERYPAPDRDEWGEYAEQPPG